MVTSTRALGVSRVSRRAHPELTTGTSSSRSRAQVERGYQRPIMDRLVRGLLFTLFPHPERLRVLALGLVLVTPVRDAAERLGHRPSAATGTRHVRSARAERDARRPAPPGAETPRPSWPTSLPRGAVHGLCPARLPRCGQRGHRARPRLRRLRCHRPVRSGVLRGAGRPHGKARGGPPACAEHDRRVRGAWVGADRRERGGMRFDP